MRNGAGDVRVARPKAVGAGRNTDAHGRSVLRGELDNVGLPTLLTILEMERRSGLLVVERERITGRVWVRDGRVIEGGRRSELRGTGIDAVCAMLGWEDGQFELWQGVSSDSDDGAEITESTTYLLMEAARRSDEARGIAPQSTAFDATGDFVL
jgi:hypothetical protein